MMASRRRIPWLNVGVAALLALTALAAAPAKSPASWMKTDFLSRRTRFEEKGATRILTNGAVLSNCSSGAGVYTVTFAVDESHDKFEYHQPCFVLGYSPPVDGHQEMEKAFRSGDDATYYTVLWRDSGLVHLSRTVEGETEKLGAWIQPGPKKRTSYAPGEFVTMNVVVDNDHKIVELYLKRKVSGEPDCQFELPVPVHGQFGFQNPKAFSTIFFKKPVFEKRTPAQ